MQASGEQSPFECGSDALLHEDYELEAEEKEVVQIVPSFQAQRFQLLRGSVGPFRPQVPVLVPLWLALLLRRRGRCKITPPDWLSTEHLDGMLERERDAGQAAFAQVPFRYLEVGTQLLKHARDDVPNAEAVSDRLESLRERRAQKLHAGLRGFEPNSLTSQVPRLDRLSAMEVSLVRRFFTSTLRRFYYHLAAPADDPDNQQNKFNQPSAASFDDAPAAHTADHQRNAPNQLGMDANGDNEQRRQLPGR